MENETNSIICLNCGQEINIVPENDSQIIICENCGNIIELFEDNNLEETIKINTYETNNTKITEKIPEEKNRHKYRPFIFLIVALLTIFKLYHIINAHDKITYNDDINNFFEQTEVSKREIISLYEDIKTAEINEDYELLLSYASKNSFEYFDKIKNLTLNANSITINKLGPFERMLILYFRGSLSADKLNEMPSDDYFIYYFQNRMIIKGVIKDRYLEYVSVIGDEASAKVNSKILPYKSSYIISFHKEYDSWKFDFQVYFELANNMFKDEITNSDKSEEEYIKSVLISKGVTKDYNELWKPINDKK